MIQLASLSQQKKQMQMMVLFTGQVLHLQGKSLIPKSQTIANIASAEHVNAVCAQGCLKEALQVLHVTDCYLEPSIYIHLLQGCVRSKALTEGKRVHAHIRVNGLIGERAVENTLINMYVKCKNVMDARRVFDQMPERDVCSWTVMIAAYAKNGYAEEALWLFHEMQVMGIEPNHFTFANVLPACADMASLEKIHEKIVRTGIHSHVCVMNALVDMYAKCGKIQKAHELFDKMTERNVVSWTVIISAYSRHGPAEEALRLFTRMNNAGGVKPNHFTFASVLCACGKLGCIEQGLEIHKQILRSGFHCDVAVVNALIDMYAKCGSIDKARDLFDEMHERDVVSWNVMIAGYAQNGFVEEAMMLFHEMPQRNVVTWTGMVTGFVQNGLVEEALKLFEEMPQRTPVSWNAMIAGLAQNGYSEEGLDVFHQMQLAGVKPDAKTFASILPACSTLAALQKGIEIHEKVIRSGFQHDVFVTNALIDMYAKCGRLQQAHELFDEMMQRNIISWTTMIAGYAMHGFVKEALELFQQMKNSGMSPDDVTFVSVLSACSHAGLVIEGYKHFNSMRECYHITPTMEHYRCMVDLLGRAGHLHEAWDFIAKMPVKPDAIVWICLLGACRVHNNIELAESVAEQVFELDPQNAAPYVLLSNIYAVAGRWNGIEGIRKMMKDRRITKTPGCSWIEIDKHVHAFLVGDR